MQTNSQMHPQSASWCLRLDGGNFETGYISQTFLSKEVMPKVFTGAENEDFDLWHRRFNLYYTTVGYTDDMKRRIFPLYMMESAEVYYYDLHEDICNNYSKLVDCFNKKFSIKKTFFLENKLYTRKQGPSETIHSYATGIHALCSKLGIKPMDRLFHFIRGLKDAIKQFVLLKDAKDVDDAEDLAKLFEQIELMSAGSNKSPDSQSEGNKYEQNIELPKKIKKHNRSWLSRSTEGWVTQDRKHCFCCGELGHIKRYCLSGDGQLIYDGVNIT